MLCTFEHVYPVDHSAGDGIALLTTNVCAYALIALICKVIISTRLKLLVLCICLLFFVLYEALLSHLLPCCILVFILVCLPPSWKVAVPLGLAAQLHLWEISDFLGVSEADGTAGLRTQTLSLGSRKDCDCSIAPWKKAYACVWREINYI